MYNRVRRMPVVYYPVYVNPYINNISMNNEIKNEENITHKDERFIPFVGGALIGGVLGSAYSRPRYYSYPVYPYYPYPTYYQSSSYSYGYPLNYPTQY